MATMRPLPSAPPPPPAEAARVPARPAEVRPAPAAKHGGMETASNANTAQAMVPAASTVISGPAGMSEEEERRLPDLPVVDVPVIDGPVARLPVELEVVVPVRDFRVRRLLALEPGELIESQWNYGEDVPLSAGDVQLAWSEFEVLDNQIAVRITRLP